MTIYWITFIMFFLIENRIRNVNIIANNWEKNGYFFSCIIMGVWVFALYAFRGVSMGMYDVSNNYLPIFNRIYDYKWGELFAVYSSDYLFYIFTKIVRTFTDNINIWIAIVSMPIVISITKLIQRKSSSAWMSWLIFFTMGYFSLHVTVLKQSIAMAFGIFAYLCIEENKKKKAILLCVLAIGFHTSGILTLIPVVVYMIKPKMNYIKASAMTTLSFVVWFSSSILMDFLFSKIPMWRFQRYDGHTTSFNMTMLLIYLAVFLFCLLIPKLNGERKDDNAIDDTEMDFYLWMIAISLPIFAMTSSFADFYRNACYFSSFAIVLIPRTLTKLKMGSLKIACYIGVITVLLYYGVVRGMLEVSPYVSIFRSK